MKKAIIKMGWITLIVLTSILTIPANTYAQDDRGGHKDRGRNHRGRDKKEHRDNGRHEGHDAGRHWDHNNYRDIVVRNRHYFYRGGAFYERRPEGYVVIGAPVGARVEYLPDSYTVVVRHRVKYYMAGGIYFRFMPRAGLYVVVGAPL